MKNSISNTFKSIKKLPLAVSFEQIENWVQQHEFSNKKAPVTSFSKIKQWVYFFSKN